MKIRFISKDAGGTDGSDPLKIFDNFEVVDNGGATWMCRVPASISDADRKNFIQSKSDDRGSFTNLP